MSLPDTSRASLSSSVLLRGICPKHGSGHAAFQPGHLSGRGVLKGCAAARPACRLRCRGPLLPGRWGSASAPCRDADTGCSGSPAECAPAHPSLGAPPFWTLIFRGGANEWRYWSKSKTQKQKAEKIHWAPGLTRRPEGGAGRGRPWGWCCPRAVCFQPLLCKGPCLGRVCIAWGRRRSAFGPIAAAFRAQAPGLPWRASEWSHHPGSGAPGLGHLAVRWQRLQASHILRSAASGP